MSISIDGASAAPLERVGAEPFLEMTNGVTLLLVNANQATVLTGREDPESAARVLTAALTPDAVTVAAEWSNWQFQTVTFVKNAPGPINPMNKANVLNISFAYQF